VRVVNSAPPSRSVSMSSWVSSELYTALPTILMRIVR